MKSLYDRVAATPEGVRDLADARLRYEVLGALHAAMRASGVSQTELARRLGVRKSAVNQVLRGDGNIQMTTAAQYLGALGFELGVSIYPLGEQRRAVVADREPVPAEVRRHEAHSGGTPPSAGYRVAAAVQHSQVVSMTPPTSSGRGRWRLRGLLPSVPAAGDGPVRRPFRVSSPGEAKSS